MRVRLLLVLGILLALFSGVPAASADPDPSVTITASPGATVAGGTVHFNAVVSNGHNGILQITVTTAVSKPAKFELANPVNNDSHAFVLALYVNTTLTAQVVDQNHVATGPPASVVVRVRPQIASRVKTDHTQINRYAVMRAGTSPQFQSAASPMIKNRCLRHEVQRQRAGVWRTVVVSGCRSVASSGLATWKWTGRHPKNVHYRVRGTFPGDAVNAAGPGAWTYFRFV